MTTNRQADNQVKQEAMKESGNDSEQDMVEDEDEDGEIIEDDEDSDYLQFETQ